MAGDRVFKRYGFCGGGTFQLTCTWARREKTPFLIFFLPVHEVVCFMLECNPARVHGKPESPESSGSQPSWSSAPLMQFLTLCWFPSLKTLSLWLLNCDLATVTRCNVNIYVFWWFYVTLWKGHLTPRSCDSQVENHCHRPWMKLWTQELSIFISSFLVFFLFTPLLPSLPFAYLFFLPILFLIWLYAFTNLPSSASGARWVIFFVQKTRDRTGERLHCKVRPL